MTPDPPDPPAKLIGTIGEPMVPDTLGITNKYTGLLSSSIDILPRNHSSKHEWPKPTFFSASMHIRHGTGPASHGCSRGPRHNPGRGQLPVLRCARNAWVKQGRNREKSEPEPLFLSL